MCCAAPRPSCTCVPSR
ncbi:hypothetical protein LEMLEM_LOCUS6901 [Lemmus lemmus]